MREYRRSRVLLLNYSVHVFSVFYVTRGNPELGGGDHFLVSFVYIYIYMYTYMYMYMYVYVCVYIYIYIHTHIHTYTYTHGSFLIRRQRGHPGVVLPLVVSIRRIVRKECSQN